MLIDEAESTLPLPSSTEDRYIESQTSPRRSAPWSPFVSVLHVTRLYPGLYQALKSSAITPQVLQSFDERFNQALSFFPEPYHPQSDSYLDPSALCSLVPLQFARYQLYRRNMSIVCSGTERLDSIRRCAAVAQDTARYISRTLKGPNPNAEVERNWRDKIAQIASNMVCVHVWRCILMLCFLGDYHSALGCCVLSSAIGEVREINTACGRNLSFFLDRLLDRKRSGNGGIHQLEHDEEMLAYVSGDMQGSMEHSWVWAGSDLAASQSSPHTSPRGGVQTSGAEEPTQGIHVALRPSSGPDTGGRGWHGWGHIETTIRQLMDESHPRPPAYYPTPHNPMKRVQLGPESPTSPATPARPARPVPPPTSSSTSRISIANII
jgi:hypothetical protein